jgi:signal transduction histidine kinase
MIPGIAGKPFAMSIMSRAHHPLCKQSGNAMAPNRILIAEDEAQLRMGITLTLQLKGYEVTEASNGADALQKIIHMKHNKTPFDLLICDIQMPRMTGEELLAKLKDFKETVPTLVLTGYGEKDLIVRLMRLGCRDFMDKPFEPEAIAHRVATIIAESSENAFQSGKIENLAGIGEKTKQLAHDLNNILCGTVGFADMALEKIEEGHPARANLEKVLKTSNRAAEICHGLLGKNNLGASSFRTTTEINALVQRISTVLRDIAPENIVVAVSTQSEPLWLNADSERLQQAILNLGFNAFSAMATGGRLSLSAGWKNALNRHVAGPQQRCAVISVEDTGTGIPEDVIDRIFKEGYTTGKNSHGLGLACVRKIVEEEHQGWIEAESTVGKGTMFRLFLPVETG